MHTMEQCIDNCTNCHRICLETAARHFRGRARSPKLEEPLVRLLLDCAEICRTSADFMIRGSDHASADLPGLLGDLQPVRRRVRSDGRGSLPGGLRRDLPALRRDLPGDGGRYVVADRQGIEPEPALRRSAGAASAVASAQPAAVHAVTVSAGEAIAAPGRRGSEPQVDLLQRDRLVGQLLHPVHGACPLRPVRARRRVHSRRFHCRSPAEPAVRRRSQPDERRPAPVGAVVPGAVAGPGRVRDLVVLEALALRARRRRRETPRRSVPRRPA